jgi:hypothetical protein
MIRYCSACRREVTIDGTAVKHSDPVCIRWKALETNAVVHPTTAHYATHEDEFEPESKLDRSGR